MRREYFYRDISVPLITVFAGGCLAFGQPTAAAAIGDDALLFVGNSYTYQSVGHNGTSVDRFFSDTQISPFEAIVRAASGNRGNETDSFLHTSGSQNIASPGQKLSQHTGFDTETSPTILSDGGFDILTNVWDTVILQDFSTVPAKTVASTGPYDSSAYEDFFVQGLTPIVDQLQSNGQTSTKIVLYETWAREAIGTGGFTNDFASRQEMYNLTSQAYSNAEDLLTFGTGVTAVQGEGGAQDPDLNGLGIPNPVVIAPVGTAIENLITDATSPGSEYAQLFADGKASSSDVFDIIYDDIAGGNPDTGSHLDLAGEFLAASVLFETIYEVSVLSLIDSGQLLQSDLNGIWTQNDSGGFTGTQDLDLDLARYLADISQQTTGAVPEPTSFVLLAAGGLILARRRRR